jgi:hypothetical protein
MVLLYLFFEWFFDSGLLNCGAGEREKQQQVLRLPSLRYGRSG